MSPFISFLTVNVGAVDKADLSRRRLVWCGLALVVLFFGHPVRALADDKPILCASDGGKTWYFSFGTDVFEMTPVSADILDKHHVLVSNDPVSDQLVPPDPWAPLGCFGNPQQLFSFSAGGWPRFQPEGYNGDLPSGGVVQLFRRGRVEQPEFVGPINVQNLSRRGGPCYKDAFISELSDGSFYCSSSKDGLKNLYKRNLIAWDAENIVVWSFLPSKKTYSTPLGYQFIVRGSSYDALWQSSYQIDPYIYIWYRWYMPAQASNVDLRYFIDIDLSVLKGLDSSEIHKYPWPNQKIKLWPVESPVQP